MRDKFPGFKSAHLNPLGRKISDTSGSIHAKQLQKDKPVSLPVWNMHPVVRRWFLTFIEGLLLGEASLQCEGEVVGCIVGAPMNTTLYCPFSHGWVTRQHSLKFLQKATISSFFWQKSVHWPFILEHFSLKNSLLTAQEKESLRVILHSSWPSYWLNLELMKTSPVHITPSNRETTGLWIQ